MNENYKNDLMKVMKSTQIKRNFLNSIKYDKKEVNEENLNDDKIFISTSMRLSKIRQNDLLKYNTERCNNENNIILKLPSKIKKKIKYVYADLKSFARKVE